MSSESSVQPNFSSDELLLIEYLDGELTQTDRKRIEDRLVKEPDLREKLAKLEESWRFLDQLEAFSTDKELVETTLETVILVTEQEISQQIKAVRRRFSWKFVVRPLTLFVLFGVGVFGGGRLAPDKNFFLRVASPIIERLEMYRLMYDQDPELLPLLAQQRVFLPPLAEGEQSIDLAEYHPSPSAKMIFPNFRETHRRIAQINGLDDALFKQVYYNNEQFNELSMEKKLRLRMFHERIELSPRRSELLQTLQAYYHWRKSLQPYERMEIAKSLSVEQRVKQIALLKVRLERALEVPGAVPLRDDEQAKPTLEELAKILADLDWQNQEFVLNLSPEQALSYLIRFQQKP